MRNFYKSAMLAITFLAIPVMNAGAQLLTASPAKLSFATSVGAPVEQQTTVKIAGLLGSPILTNYSATITGAGAANFSVQTANPSLNDLLNGTPVTITYNPAAPGSHSANVVVNVSLLGINLSSVTIPVTGMTFTSTPPLGSSVNVENIGEEFATQLTFSQDVYLNSFEAIHTEDNMYEVFVYRLINRNAIELFVPSSFFPRTPIFNLTIPYGHLKDGAGTPIGPFKVNYLIDPRPYVISVDPAPSTINTNANVSQTFIFTFNREVVSIMRPAIQLTGSSALRIASYTVKENIFTVNVEGTVTEFDTFTLTIPNGAFIDLTPLFLPYAGGSWNYAFRNDNLVRNTTGIESSTQHKPVASETYYTITGVPVDINAMQPGSVYIKKTVYKDGSAETVKHLHSVR